MAVAVKNTTESTVERSLNRLAVDSLLGVLYVLGCLGILFAAIPWLWSSRVGLAIGEAVGPYVSTTFEILVMVALAGVMVSYGGRLLATRTVPGLRAGIVAGLLGIVVIALFTSALGSALAERMGEENVTAMAITAAVGIALVVLGVIAYARPGFEKWLVLVEEQGWFHATVYKRNQGQRVRRGTILGILVLAGCGIYTLLRHNTLTAGPQDWHIPVPFTYKYIILLPDVAVTLPLVLAIASLWLAWRVVNLPTFADFLIATEAELNKVSWTTRRRLIQDTIVVLVTVILLTVFLFVVDQIWAFTLTKVGVIQIAPSATQQTGAQEQSW
jgi:preprotein translocase SecE subunit